MRKNDSVTKLNAPGRGRKLGSKNKINGSIQEMLLASLTKQGGEAFFNRLAIQEPKTYAMLISKLIPLQLLGGGQDGALQISVVYEAPKKTEAPPKVVPAPKPKKEG